MNERRFYICEICGNIVQMIHSTGVPVNCCGDEMKELVPGSVDASQEKHVPVVCVDGDKVTVDVGSDQHPMEDSHSIEWIYLETANGGQYHYLKPEKPPTAVFSLNGEKPVAAYAYCNLHGLWKKEI